jgi:hypothetical protein
MKMMLSALTTAAALVATDASAQGVNLTGQYRCVNLCADGLVGTPTAVNQYGWDMNLVNEVGQPVRAWVDRPGHIWVERWNQGAVYSPDGMVIQFDRGTVWQRDLGQFDTGYLVPAKPQAPVKTKPVIAPISPAPSPAARTANFDGSWSVTIVTESGPCDRAYRYGVQITNGYVSSDAAGGVATLQGRVAPNGSVRVNVSAGAQFAEGQGRMSSNVGTGTWQGQGPGGACAGSWQAQRRG